MPDTATAAEISPAPIPMLDLAQQRRRIAPEVDAAIARVLRHGAFILGPEVAELERRLAQYCGVAHVVTCGSGADALLMGLMALGVGPGDAVLVPSFTFTATAEAPALLGATPIFIDVAADTFNITADALARGTRTARAAGLKPVAAIPVDLFGQPADYDSLAAVATREHVTLLADAAQSFGASLGNRKVGALAPLTTTSFYPSKPFGCYGDGGAVMTDDADLADRLRQIRTHGQRRHRDDVVCIGLTSRLDTIQAAILIEKLAIFDDECRRRDHAARRYAELLGDAVEVPRVVAGRTSVWAQYTVLSPRRDAIAAALKAEQIACSIFYPVPVHQQGPYRGYPVAEGGLPVTVRLAKEAISLPLHPYLSSDDQARVALAVVRAAA
jgi:dTDP-4-amino-4,6-dideoxygalactose transaminase